MLYKASSEVESSSVEWTMSGSLHILSFQKKLREERQFLQSLLSKQPSKRKWILESAKDSQLRLLQKLITLFLRGEIPITPQIYSRIKKSKKLAFIESKFNKIQPDPKLREHILTLAPVLPLFLKVILQKK